MPNTSTNSQLPGYYPPSTTNDPAILDAQIKLKQISAKLGQQLIAPGNYTLQAGATIVVNAQGQITSITNP